LSRNGHCVKAEERADPRGAVCQGAGGVQHRAPLGPHSVRQEQHPGPHQLSQQQEAARSRQGIRQTLQHGAGECEGDVDGGAQDWQGQEEVQARQQGPLHLQDVPPRRLCHSRPPQSTPGSLNRLPVCRAASGMDNTGGT